MSFGQSENVGFGSLAAPQDSTILAAAIECKAAIRARAKLTVPVLLSLNCDTHRRMCYAHDNKYFGNRFQRITKSLRDDWRLEHDTLNTKIGEKGIFS